MSARGEALWDAAEAAYYGPGGTSARLLMFQATVRMIGKRQRMADELADMLAKVLVEIHNLADMAEIIATAAAMEADR